MFFRRHGIWVVMFGIISVIVIIYELTPPNSYQYRLPSDAVCQEGKPDSEVAATDVLIERFEEIAFRKYLNQKERRKFTYKWKSQIRVDALDFSDGYKAYLALTVNQLACLTGLNILFGADPDNYLKYRLTHCLISDN